MEEGAQGGREGAQGGGGGPRVEERGPGWKREAQGGGGGPRMEEGAQGGGGSSWWRRAEEWVGASLSSSSGCVTEVIMAVSRAIGVWGKNAATKGSRMPLHTEPSDIALYPGCPGS